MTTTTAQPSTAGEQTVLASYESEEGTRQLVGQRVNGSVHLSDIPAGDEGRVYLVEPRIGCMKELEALVEDYVAKASERGIPPMAPGAWWR